MGLMTFDPHLTTNKVKGGFEAEGDKDHKVVGLCVCSIILIVECLTSALPDF